MNKAAKQQYRILDIRIDALTMNEAAKRICERASDTNQKATYVVKPYVEYMDQAHRDPKLAKLLENAWLSLPDAVSLQWAATYVYGGAHTWQRVVSLGAKIVLKPQALTDYIPERFAGATFTWQLLEAAAKHSCSVYLIGSPHQSSAAATARTIRKRLPNLDIVGTWPGNLQNKAGVVLQKAIEQGPIESTLVADIKQKKPNLILVGMGFPLQETLMAKIAPQLSHGVLIGEGGTFDYDSFGGVRKRAPQLVRTIGLEWLWRLILEPKRIGRQKAIPRFIWAIYRSTKR